MKAFSRPSPAMVVAVISLIVAIGGTAAALPGKRTVDRADLRTGSVGARALGPVLLNQRAGVRSADPVADDQVFTETVGSIRCPSKAPFALDPSIGIMGSQAYEARRSVLPNRWGGPGGYSFIVSGDEGPEVGYTMTVNCLPRR